MSRGRFRLVAVAILAFAMVMSSCFVIRVVQLTNKSLGPGEQTRFKVSMYRAADNSDSTGYVFLLVGLEDLDLSNFAKFDQKENFGGPFNSTSDNSLRDELVGTAALCTAGGMSAKEVYDAGTMDSWHAYRTTVKVNSTNGGFNARNLVKFLLTRSASTSDVDYGQVVIFGGTWIDPTNDGAATSAAEVGCTSVIWTNVAFVP